MTYTRPYLAYKGNIGTVVRTGADGLRKITPIFLESIGIPGLPNSTTGAYEADE